MLLAFQRSYPLFYLFRYDRVISVQHLIDQFGHVALYPCQFGFEATGPIFICYRHMFPQVLEHLGGNREKAL
ncbi:hypothetical protein LPB140_10295 [Sphingorhabdus lutea]|uniref:Uncharacterized protein n=1 Tax=Sphingorhabdus lutea TaxID=1913578 RepID=A0A1L3JD76_9SPHN|nr:hypothetical protein LPB140_10295 [Sphingorhabdus lutea]